MSAAYLRFLQSPNTADLASDASIHYITTTTTINEPTAILKHFVAQSKQLEKKQEKVLFTIDGDNASSIETLTSLQFRAGGGAYLPGIDSNMLDEREVTFPLTHIVTYNPEGKIQQVRLYWDQGTLLKQVEVIGKSGRNWPIRDGKAQADAVAASIKSSGGGQAAKSNGKSSDNRAANDVVIRDSKRDSVSVTRDPHASLNLFAERDPNEEASRYSGPRYETAKSAKPGPRDYGELFATEETPATLGASVRSPSPHKSDGTILKVGAGKNFTGNRIFDENEAMELPKSPERKKVYNQKYDHFAFGDGEDAPQDTRKSNRGKNQQAAPFSFEDFATPPKHIEKHKPDFERHWGAGVDEDDPTNSPPKRPIVHAARKDAVSHFELTDDSPANQKTQMHQRQKTVGTYQNPEQEVERTKPTATNVDKTRRGDDFDAHYSMTDNSPAGAKPQDNKHAVRSDLASHWGFDSAPVQEKKIYKTAGDGMGGRSGPRQWGIGDSDPEDADDANTVRRSARSRHT